MKSAAAVHEASRNVVAVDLSDRDYLASVQATRDANRDFVAWIRRALAASLQPVGKKVSKSDRSAAAEDLHCIVGSNTVHSVELS